MAKYTSTLFKKSKNLNRLLVLISILVLTIILSLNNFNLTHVEAHNPDAYPMEIFSLWNDTNPTIDGKIMFTPSSLSGEWSSAAVYDLFDNSGSADGKVLIQNDNNYLYIAFDCVSYTVEDPGGIWGSTIFLDADHNGIMDLNDYAVSFKENSTLGSDYYVELKRATGPGQWSVIEDGIPGSPLLISGVLMNLNFAKSAFSNASLHRQYEFRIPIALPGISTDNIFGVGFETYNSETVLGDFNTWPYVKSNPKYIRIDAKYWGDLHLGDEFLVYTGYVIEDNFNIHDDAVGKNNGTFLFTADIDGNGDLELIVSSNSTSSSGDNLIAIYDYDQGEIKQIWKSWTSDHKSDFFVVRDIAAFDFDQNGEDELFLTGDDDFLWRLKDWDADISDFINFNTIFYNEYPISSIDIGRAMHNGEYQILISDDYPTFAMLEYVNDTGGESFNLWDNSWFIPFDVGGNPTTAIPTVAVADMEDDNWDEILFLIEFDSVTGDTGLEILEWHYKETPFVLDDGFYDNGDIYPGEDDLPYDSSPTTYDRYGHTIVVGDVDTDGYNETIIIGKDYLKIFGSNTYTQPSPPFEILLNDGTTEPSMAGGAAIIDIDDDTFNELIYGCANGTVVILEFWDNNGDPTLEDLEYVEEWRGDLGTSPGFKNAIVGFDIDQDGMTEAIIGDNFGQIIVLGKGTIPEVTVTSPTPGYTSNKDTIRLTWVMSNDSLPMYSFNIYVNGFIETRGGGGQRSCYISLDVGYNSIDLVAFDITGKVAFGWTWVDYIVGGPEITITSPSNFHATSSSTQTIVWLAMDPQDDPIIFDVWRNSTQVAYGIPASLYDVYLPSDGIWNITVVVIDTISSDTARDSIYVRRDSTAPTIDITAPTDDSAVNVDEIDLRWTAFDEGVGVEKYDIFVDGSWYVNTMSTSYLIPLPVDKEYLIEVIAYDKLSNSDFDSITITRDTLDPSVAFDPLGLPMIDTWYYTSGTNVGVDWVGADNAGGSGIESYVIEVNDVFYDSYLHFENSSSITLGDDGMKEIVIIAYDYAGNTAIDHFLVAKDTTDPTISITSPVNNYNTSDDTVLVTWSSADSGTGIDEHQIFVNGSLYTTLTDPTVKYCLIDIPDNTSYIISVIAYDYLNRFESDTITVNHDPFAPTFWINDPFDISSYSSDTNISISWDVYNIFADEFIVYVNGTEYENYTSSTFNAWVNLEDRFGPIPEGSFPIANITVVVSIGGLLLYSDTRFVNIDQSDPSVSILDPSDLDIIIDDSIYVEWAGFDAGSGIAYYDAWINGDKIGSWSSSTTSQYIDVSGYDDGWHTLTMYAFDYAGNQANYSIDLELYPQAPEFSVNLDSYTVTNDPNFDLNITVFDPRLGVSEVQVVVDSEVVVFFMDYGSSYQYDPFWLETAINQSDFVASGDLHNVTITVYDKVDRGRIMVLDVIIDMEDPDLFSKPIFGDRVLFLTGNTVEIVGDTSQNIHNISLSASDLYGVDSVYLTLAGDSYNETFLMTLESEINDIYSYSYSLDLNNFTNGNYTIEFTIIDNAGNSMQSSYEMTIQTAQATPTNWFMEHLYDIVLPSAGGLLFLILFPTILSVATRKRRMNKGWKEALEAVAFVTKTGLTLAYVPYCKDLFEDEQLFGGALTGVVGILGEITGEAEVQMQVHVLEFGDKRLLVCSGYFGNAILLVNDVKPILNDLIKKFLMEFELTYKIQLAQELIDLNEFSAVPLMVESIFGFREQYLKETLEQYREEHLSFEQQPNYEEQPSYEQQQYQEPQYSQEEQQQPQDQQDEQQPYDQQYNQEQNHDQDEY